MAGERSDLGKIFITPGGDYDATVTYETLTMVKYNNSLYLTLRTVTGVTPSDDRVNYLLMAQGFTATRLESITAVDQQGLVTDPGDEMPAQTLINAIADRVVNQLVSNSDLQDTLLGYVAKSAVTESLNATEDGKILNAKAGKTLNDALSSTNDAVSALTATESTTLSIFIFHKIGKMVIVTTRDDGRLNPIQQFSNVGTLPTNYRPAYGFVSPMAWGGYVNVPGAVRITTSGAVDIYASSAQSNVPGYVNCTYYTN